MIFFLFISPRLMKITNTHSWQSQFQGSCELSCPATQEIRPRNSSNVTAPSPWSSRRNKALPDAHWLLRVDSMNQNMSQIGNPKKKGSKISKHNVTCTIWSIWMNFSTLHDALHLNSPPAAGSIWKVREDFPRKNHIAEHFHFLRLPCDST